MEYFILGYIFGQSNSSTIRADSSLTNSGNILFSVSLLLIVAGFFYLGLNIEEVTKDYFLSARNFNYFSFSDWLVKWPGAFLIEKAREIPTFLFCGSNASCQMAHTDGIPADSIGWTFMFLKMMLIMPLCIFINALYPLLFMHLCRYIVIHIHAQLASKQFPTSTKL